MLLTTQSESNRQEVTELMQGTGHSLPSWENRRCIVIDLH